MSHDPVRAFAPLAAGMVAALDVSGLWTPELTATTTNPNLGADGSATGGWHVTGHLVTCWGRFVFAGSGISPGSGAYRISVPFAPDLSLIDQSGTTGDGTQVGFGRLRDNSAGANSQSVVVQFVTGGVLALLQHATNNTVSNSSPFTPADGDRISFQATYPIDPSELPLAGA